MPSCLSPPLKRVDTKYETNTLPCSGESNHDRVVFL